MEANSSQTVGLNYRVIPGKQRNSKIYVKEPFTYVMDRWAQNPVDKQPMLYLKCRYPAVIIDDFLSTTLSKHAHTCNESESGGMAKITALEITNKMKMRAELEMTSFYVSIFIISFLLSCIVYILTKNYVWKWPP